MKSARRRVLFITSSRWTMFSLSLMHKDLGLVMREAAGLSVPMPATRAAEQMYAAAMAKRIDEDFSVVIRFMRTLAGVTETAIGKSS